jgi:hypothetical protein
MEAIHNFFTMNGIDGSHCYIPCWLFVNHIATMQNCDLMCFGDIRKFLFGQESCGSELD